MKPQLHDPTKAREYFAEKLAYTLGPAELNHWLTDKEKGFAVVDVRRPEDYDKGHIPGAISLPLEKWGGAAGLNKDNVHVFYCYTQQCHLATKAALEFSAKGFSCIELEGGIQAWKDYKLPVETREAAGVR